MGYDDTLRYDVKKKVILRMYEMMIIYKFELLRNEDNNEKKDKIEVEIYELINSIQELLALMNDIIIFCIS